LDERTDIEGMGAGVWGQSPQLGDERTYFGGFGSGGQGVKPPVW
jgi:hypothetical protein